jgi:hypothetical protein
VGLFGFAFVLFFALGLAPVVIGIAALIGVGTTPADAFGPWWDNTRQSWLIGIAVSFLVPFGPLVSGLFWFTTGRAPLRAGARQAGRPPWSGPPRPAPPHHANTSSASGLPPTMGP